MGGEFETSVWQYPHQKEKNEFSWTCIVFYFCFCTEFYHSNLIYSNLYINSSNSYFLWWDLILLSQSSLFRSGSGDFEWTMLLEIVLCAFWNDFSEGGVTTDSGRAFHVSTIQLLKLLLLISLSSSSLRLCPLVGLSLENVNLVNFYLLRPFYLAGLGSSVGCQSTGDQEGVSSRLRSGNILSLRLIMKSFLWSFSPFRWFKKGSCQLLAKECALSTG